MPIKCECVERSVFYDFPISTVLMRIFFFFSCHSFLSMLCALKLCKNVLSLWVKIKSSKMWKLARGDMLYFVLQCSIKKWTHWNTVVALGLSDVFAVSLVPGQCFVQFCSGLWSFQLCTVCLNIVQAMCESLVSEVLALRNWLLYWRHHYERAPDWYLNND